MKRYRAKRGDTIAEHKNGPWVRYRDIEFQVKEIKVLRGEVAKLARQVDTLNLEKVRLERANVVLQTQLEAAAAYRNATALYEEEAQRRADEAVRYRNERDALARFWAYDNSNYIYPRAERPDNVCPHGVLKSNACQDCDRNTIDCVLHELGIAEEEI